MKKAKFYVVWVGREVGVYTNWPQAEAQVKGFSGASFKSFDSMSIATHEFDLGCQKLRKPLIKLAKKPVLNSKLSLPNKPDYECITVDGAFSSSTKAMEYQCVMNISREIIFRSQPLIGGSNNLAEFLALIDAIRYREKTKQENLHIYSDSATALAWLRDKKVNTTINLESANPLIKEMIDTSLAYLKSTDKHNNIFKWTTSLWGEIPADFNRK